MKNLTLLVWLSQLGLNVALPLLGFILLAAWLHNSCGWGSWVIWVGVILGVVSAISGFRNTLQTMDRLAGDGDKEEPSVSFNEHE